MRSSHFVTEFVRLAPGAATTPDHQACHLWICLEGDGTVGGYAFRPSEVWWLPAPAEVRAQSPARFLRTWYPA